MPPKKEDRLSAAEVELIRKWIAAGAVTGSSAVEPKSEAVGAA